MWAAVGTARRGSVRGYGCAAAPGRPGRRRTVGALRRCWVTRERGCRKVWEREGRVCRGQRQERRQHIPVRGAAPARGETFQDGRGTWTAGAALRVIVVLLTCSPSGERRVLSSAGAAVAWSSPGAPTRAGGCRPTSRGFTSELMTCPALLHLSDRISAVLLDVREHTNGTDRSQRSMARSHIPERVRAVRAFVARCGRGSTPGRCAGGPLCRRAVTSVPCTRRRVTSVLCFEIGRLIDRSRSNGPNSLRQ
jgi:hypothetical protein